MGIVDVAATAEEDDESRHARLDALSIQLWGPIFAVVGTLIRGYGDLVAAAVFDPIVKRHLQPGANCIWAALGRGSTMLYHG